MKTTDKKFIEEVGNIIETEFKENIYKKLNELHQSGITLLNPTVIFNTPIFKNLLEEYNLDYENIKPILEPNMSSSKPNNFKVVWSYGGTIVEPVIKGSAKNKEDIPLLNLLEEVTKQKTANPVIIVTESQSLTSSIVC